MYEKNMGGLGRKTVSGKQHGGGQRTVWWIFHATSPLLNLLWADTRPVRCTNGFSLESPSPLRDGEPVSHKSEARYEAEPRWQVERINITFAELIWGYKNVLTSSRTSPASLLEIQVLAGRLGRNRRKREELQGS